MNLRNPFRRKPPRIMVVQQDNTVVAIQCDNPEAQVVLLKFRTQKVSTKGRKAGAARDVKANRITASPLDEDNFNTVMEELADSLHG